MRIQPRGTGPVNRARGAPARRGAPSRAPVWSPGLESLFGVARRPGIVQHRCRTPATTMSSTNEKPYLAAWLHGGSVACGSPATAPERPYRLVLLGAPGVGKGTQAELLASHLGACQLSTGDVFRAAKDADPAARSPKLNEALEFMRRGELVPDETVIGIVRERAGCLRYAAGFLLDGFPRTVAQAEALAGLLAEQGIALDAVLSYELPLERIVARLAGRRTCGQCKAVFHVESIPPKVEGVCDHCGGALVQREDDRPESIRVRMAAYETSTRPLADFYARQGLLRTISAEGSPEAIYQRTEEVLRQLG